MDSIKLLSNKVYLSESEENPDVLIAKFIVCDFSVNENSVALDRDTIDSWVGTLVNKPVVGKVTVSADGKADFTGHNAKVVIRKDSDGTLYEDLEFDTSAFGTFVSVGIEEIDGDDYITATAEIWKRFTKACEIIKERVESGSLSTSWEIRVIEAEEAVVNKKKCRKIKSGAFLGHCLLGRGVLPAYPSSGLLSVASEGETDTELASALTQDILESSVDSQLYRKENETLKNEKVTEVVAEVEEPIAEEAAVSEEVEAEVVETEVVESEVESAEAETEVEEPEVESDEPVEETSESEEESAEAVETSALTVNDLRARIGEACAKKLKCGWCYVAFFFPADNTVWVEDCNRESELEYIKFTYEVINDEVIVSDGEPVVLTVSPRDFNDRISELEASIESLRAENEELSKYRDEHEEAKKCQRKKCLTEYVVKSGRFTDDELEDENSEVNKFIAELNEAGIKAIIADRCVAEHNVEPSAESKPKYVAEINPSVEIDAHQVMRDFLR